MVFAHLDDKADNHTYRLQGKVCVHKVQKCFFFFQLFYFLYIYLCVYTYINHISLQLLSLLSVGHHRYIISPGAGGEFMSLNAASSVFIYAVVKIIII